MTSKAVHLLVFDGYADWEPAHALAELRRSGNRSVVVVGFSDEPVTSMGGLRVLPDITLREIRLSEVEILVLPGGDFWEGSYPEAELNRRFAVRGCARGHRWRRNHRQRAGPRRFCARDLQRAEDFQRRGRGALVRHVQARAAPRVGCLKYLVGDENHTNAALPQLAPLILLTRHMDDTNKPLAPWTASRSAKEKNIVQRAVTALLDQLAPERVLKRGDQILAAVEQHRTPKGCVLQAPTAAVSVSWFADAGKDSPLGELHIIVWSGVVSRRGRAAIPEGAKVVKELVVRPIESPLDEFVWRAADGSEFDTAALAARCIAMLEEQL